MEFKDLNQRLRFKDTRDIRARSAKEMEKELNYITNRICELEEELQELQFHHTLISCDIMMKRFLDDLEDYDKRGFDLNKLIYDDTDYSLKIK